MSEGKIIIYLAGGSHSMRKERKRERENFLYFMTSTLFGSNVTSILYIYNTSKAYIKYMEGSFLCTFSI